MREAVLSKEDTMTRKRQSLAEYKRQEDPKPKAKQIEEAKAQSNLYGGLFVLGVIVVAALAIYFYLNREAALPELTTNLDISSIPDNSEGFANQGNNHIASTEPREPYNSNPPTSGAHNPRWVTPLQVYTQEMPDDMLIHNLEHGHIWLSYRDADDTEAIALLRAFQRKYSDRVIVSYRPENPSRIAVAAWTRLLSLDELDEEQIEAFIIRYNNKAPESILGR
jgi:hypothetical protein